MSVVAILTFAAISAAQPAMVAAADADRTPIRCRPGPYLVAELAERPKAERLLVTGSRVPMVVRDYERRPRPCLLMRGPDLTPNPLRAAD
jgi:hypothetical protein